MEDKQKLGAWNKVQVKLVGVQRNKWNSWQLFSNNCNLYVHLLTIFSMPTFPSNPLAVNLAQDKFGQLHYIYKMYM